MNKDQLERAKNLFFIALGADIAVTVIVVFSNSWSIRVLEDIGAGLIKDTSWVISKMEFWESFAKLIFLTMFGVGIGLVNWLYKCYRYAKEVLGASGFKNEGWVVAGWIVPIFNTFKPYQVINEIYKAGSPTYAPPDGWRKEPDSGLLLSWWIFWAVTHFIGVFVTKSMIQNASRIGMTLQQSISAIELHTWYCVVFLVVSVLWFIVANDLTSRLLARQSSSGSFNPHGTSQSQQRPRSPSFVTPVDGVSMSAMHTNTGTGKRAISPESTSDEDYWAVAMAEVEGAQRRPGLWAKAFAEAQGNEDAAKANYIKWRVVQLKDEEAKRVQKNEEAQLAERAKIYGECPSCSREILWSETKCPHCRASFGLGSPYRIGPLQKK
jgi:hypothetical protein